MQLVHLKSALRNSLKMVVRMKTFGLFIVILLFPLLYLFILNHGYVARLSSYESANASKTLRFSTESPEPPVRRILLVTYGRSGSTFLSYILKEVPDSFFFFEPLRALLMGSTGGKDVIMNYEAIRGRYLEPQELQVSNLTTYEHHAVDVMSELFNCDISKYPVANYRSLHFKLHGDVAKVAKCLWSMVNDTYLNLSSYLQCLLDFQHACQKAPLRIFKVIRLPIRSVFPLMRRFPDLKVVYLVRDPRAILQSQRALFGHAPKSQDFCKMVVDDAQHLKLLQRTFPGRAVAVRYEDVSSDPLEKTARLYKALNLEMTSHVVNSVKQMTSSTQKNNGDYSSFRSDSKKAAEKWRTKAHMTSVMNSDNVCQDVYRLLGYRKASSETLLRNLTYSLVDSRSELPFL